MVFYYGGLHGRRFAHTATVLTNGKVLVTGGIDDYDLAVRTCELYDPSTGKWEKTGSMHYLRNDHTASLLLNGKVLVTGGYNNRGADVSKLCELMIH